MWNIGPLKLSRPLIFGNAGRLSEPTLGTKIFAVRTSVSPDLFLIVTSQHRRSESNEAAHDLAVESDVVAKFVLLDDAFEVLQKLVTEPEHPVPMGLGFERE